MDNANLNIDILVNAKDEYTQQLCDIIGPMMHQGFDAIIGNARKTVERRSVYRYFQELLKNIPQWNQDIIEKETLRIIKKTECDWLDELLKAVFIANAKVLSSVSINKGSSETKIDLKIPKLENFIHKCYIASAREFYKNPLLFKVESVNYDLLKINLNNIDNIIISSIKDTIRKSIPYKNLLKEYIPTIMK